MLTLGGYLMRQHRLLALRALLADDEMMQLETAETPEILRERIQQGQLPAPPQIVQLLDLCAAMPSYRSFLEAREAAPNQRIPQIDQFDPQATLDALARWRQSSQEWA